MEKEPILMIDFGGTATKIVCKKANQYQYLDFITGDPTIQVQEIIHNFRKNNPGDLRILVTGGSAGSIDFDKLGLNVVKLNELECVANVIRFLNKEKGIAVNIGTGTSFVFYDKGNCQHLNGTGIGGGTFMGLAQRLLGISDPRRVEQLAQNGDLRKVNITVGDIIKEDNGWLRKDLTAANFGKPGGDERDIALGIHSIVAEPITSIARSIKANYPSELMVFCGSVIHNSLIQNLIIKYLDFANITPYFLENPGFATCFGGIALYQSQNNSD